MKPWWYLDNDVSNLKAWQKYLISVNAAISRLLNALMGGDYKESVCCRTGRAAQSGNRVCLYIVMPILDALFLEPGHCMKATKNPKGEKSYETVSWNRD